jgi:hypothetical protein
MDGSENISIIASWTGPKLDKPQPRSSRNRMRQEVKSQPTAAWRAAPVAAFRLYSGSHQDHVSYVAQKCYIWREEVHAHG